MRHVIIGFNSQNERAALTIANRTVLEAKVAAVSLTNLPKKPILQALFRAKEAVG
ncbi:MAG: hypothetical protein AAGA60_16730 [Cyanobacteria bacterium P01_E01_bin.42]